jgi:hypothetical protein
VKLVLERFGFGLDSTVGRLYVDSVSECWTIEDERRTAKVPGETAIPVGTYKLGLRKTGGFHERYAKRFAGMHEGMLEVLAVPGFSAILIHCGNTDEDTDGCILVVQKATMLADGEFLGEGSQVAYTKLYPQVVKALASGPVTLEVRERKPL